MTSGQADDKGIKEKRDARISCHQILCHETKLRHSSYRNIHHPKPHRSLHLHSTLHPRPNALAVLWVLRREELVVNAVN